jgi:hypothetical protein
MSKKLAQLTIRPTKPGAPSGAIELDDVGNSRIVLDKECEADLAGLEQKLMGEWHRFGKVIVGSLLVLTGVAAFVVWIMERIGGEVRQTLTFPRGPKDIDVDIDSDRKLNINLRGPELHNVVVVLNEGQYDSKEAEEFIAAHKRFKR